MSSLSMGQAGSGASPPAGAQDDGRGQAFLRSLVTYIPSEALALYLFLLGVWVPAAGTPPDQVHRIQVTGFAIGLVAAVTLVLAGYQRDEGAPVHADWQRRLALMVIAGVAFCAYSMATPGGPWEGTWAGIQVSQLGAGLAAILALAIPVVAHVLGLDARAAAARQPQTITFAAILGQAASGGPLTLSASAGSGLPVTYAAEGSCSVSGDVLSFDGAGSCSVTASQGGDLIWAAARPVTRSFEIGP